jgi:glycosyltransferase involved in cell wall biosynthesis
MKLLLACEFYFPSVGGVQEVMRQLAERLVARGHDVTVATTKLAERDFAQLNGVKIAEFAVMGNLVRGMQGDVTGYREFVVGFGADALMVKAAQQWTFDALWPVLSDIKSRKVLIPCGFSGLFEPAYENYFKQLPEVLAQWDHLIFYAKNYRDINFARQHALTHFTILPNGASEVEFGVTPALDFRARYGIDEDSFLILTVGSLMGMKGHSELAEAFYLLEPKGRHVSLILNGNAPPSLKAVIAETTKSPFRTELTQSTAVSSMPTGEGGATRGLVHRGLDYLARRFARVFGLLLRFSGVLEREGWPGVRWRLRLMAERKLGLPIRVWRAVRRDGVKSVARRFVERALTRLEASPLGKWLPEHWKRGAKPYLYWLHKANRKDTMRAGQLLDLPREELVQAYMAADLFVFASNIEYSPLVLYESAAAGTPFLTVPVGNSEEIARWTGAGIICPAAKDERGYTRVAPQGLAEAIAAAMAQPDNLIALGQAGRKNWAERFTWSRIALQYEAILAGALPNPEAEP